MIGGDLTLYIVAISVVLDIGGRIVDADFIVENDPPLKAPDDEDPP